MAAKKNTGKRISLERQVYDLKQLLEISKSLNSTMDLSVLIEAFLYICMGQFQTTGAGLFAKPNFDATYFELGQNFYGFDARKGVDYSIPEAHPLVSVLGRCSDCTTMDKILESGIEADATVAALKSLSPSLIVPLKAKGVVNGILILGEQIAADSYSDYEKEQAATMASLAAIAINNAMLLDMSATDIMTRLKLKHYFFTALAEKMEETANKGTSLSIIMLDIDFFKKFNDTFGHECGDVVLRRTAEIIRKSIRAQDLAARYGGEEFVVMLCETGLATAEKVAERILESVENMDIVYEHQHLTITISAGACQYDPVVDASPLQLVDRADKALYVSKQNGRNRVTAAFALPKPN